MAVKPIPEKYHSITPYLVVEGADKLLEFVKQAFDAVAHECMRRPDGTLQHGEVKIGDSIVMLGEASRAQELAQALDERGLFVAGFFFPVVPKGQARIRTQMSAALTEADIDFAIAAFAEAGKALGIV